MPSASGGFAMAVNGQIYNGWDSIEVTRSLDVMAPAFDIQVTERWPGHPDQWPVKTGDAVKLTIDGELVLTGWVDAVEPKIEAQNHSVKIRGRGRTCDLIDCSALNRPGSWKGRKLEQIVTDLCQPFGISVTATGDTGDVFKAFALQQGEAVKDAIDRLIQQRGVLPIETPEGNLMLVTPGSARFTGQLALGVNVEIGEAKHNAAERFSLYVVKGQRKGDDHDHGKTVSQVASSIPDSQVTRYRPLMIVSEDQATGASAKTRATFAATVRAGKSQTGKLTVAGYRDAGGALWAPNTVGAVVAGDLGLNGDLLINEVKIKSAGDGSSSEIHVTRPEAYSLGEIKGVGLSRLDSRNAGRGARGGKGRKGRAGANLAALADLAT
jgi:prophage tail gpP-like protein